MILFTYIHWSNADEKIPSPWLESDSFLIRTSNDQERMKKAKEHPFTVVYTEVLVGENFTPPVEMGRFRGV